MRRAVFLDRDGVVNRAVLRDGKPYPPSSLADLRLLPGVREACRMLREAEFALILITNQPDIARGTANASEVGEIHSRLRRFLQLDDVRVCPHDDDARCDCRKPKPGLLLEAAETWNIDLGSSFVVGDRWRDVEAGQRAGCQTIFLDYGYRERQPDGPFTRVRSLLEAANWILRTVRMGVLQHG
ncbi:MAG TPA: HAD family hydrolase [Bryobacteraceae bacterium]|jgi:D-glycero-D-manno-heptose 1,7-bisphosphate phosphatase|nr:HAD family hydrolase [Bryobacteraceae bacterium]